MYRIEIILPNLIENQVKIGLNTEELMTCSIFTANSRKNEDTTTEYMG